MSMAHLEMLESEHPHVKHLQQEEIGLVLSKGLAEVYLNKPPNPIDYFAKWLLHHS